MTEIASKLAVLVGSRGKSSMRVVLPVVALVALFLGVVNASGRATATTTITVEVMGAGTVTSSPSGIKCGQDNKKCFIAYSDTGTVTLKADPGGGWDDDIWTDDCAGGTDSDCSIPLDGTDHIATANFKKTSGVSLSTLTVTYDSSLGDGNVSGPEQHAAGSVIDCGSAPAGTDCTWTVLTGSVLTVFQTPDAGDVFTGWGGACAGTGDSCTVRMDGDKQIGAAWASSTDTAQLVVNITGAGKVNGGGINCPSKCISTVALNTAVTLTASPNDGQIFTGWTGCGTTTTNPTCTLTMNGDTEVTATFAIANTLTVNLVGNGNVSGGSG